MSQQYGYTKVRRLFARAKKTMTLREAMRYVEEQLSQTRKATMEYQGHEYRLLTAAENLQALVGTIKGLQGFSARLWTKVPGKERIYVEFGPKLNGGKSWHGGVGWTGYYDVATGKWMNESWAGAATRDRYEEQVGAMKDAVEYHARSSELPDV